MSNSATAAETAETAPATPSLAVVGTSDASPKVIWSSRGNHARSRSASRASTTRSAQTYAQAAAGSKRSNAKGNGPPNKKKRVMYDYKINIWNHKEGQQSPISLADWRIMNVQLIVAATAKLKEEGPPQGGIGQKHWMEHSDGTRKTSELPDSERMGHTVIRFSTIEAQDWYQPLVDAVLGTAQDGSSIKLTTEVEANDGRARYVFSLPAADFIAFGDTKREREFTAKDLILGGLGVIPDDGDEDDKLCKIYSSFLFQEGRREDLWKIGAKFPTVLETKLDAILRGEKFGILPTAITGVRVLKKQSSTTGEERISRALKKTAIGGRSDSVDSKKRSRSRTGSDNNGEQTEKKMATGPTPEKMASE